ncbi:MAG: CxxC-x17-CxxC domain-containing protein [Patescibacteria group bacterium]
MAIQGLPENKDITYLGYSTYRDQNKLFGIKRKDRRQHTYVLGKSGTGKSVLMFNMIIQNILNGEGVCVIDPHGELVEGVLSAIPPHRIKDVVYFNPADVDYHIGFNVLEIVDPRYKNLVSSGLMGIFTKIWANAWSARMEYILNNTILALLDTPETTLLGVTRMLVDKDYRQKIISNLKDPVIKAFWIHEYEAWQDKFRNEAIAPIQNKVGQFLSSAIIRNVVGQSKSTINIFDIMNEGKIFLVNVSKGRIGEDNSRLIGGMLITKLQLAAMERVRIPEDERKDFYLYVDEFQNFVTDSFASILSEARKYRLNLIVAHQYTAQLVTKESSNVRDAIFGNVGTMIVFRVGSDDADFLEKEFMPEFTPEDVVNLPNYKVYLKLMIDGITSRPFSAKTLAPLVKSGNKEIEDIVIKSSRDLYCRPREEVENEINSWSGVSIGDDGRMSLPHNGSSPGTGEKFTTVCSTCGKETTVPFKPEVGRPVYCKDCIAKIKSGELKPIKSNFKEQKFDEAKFFKPLSDLGIEFPSADGNTNRPNVIVGEVKSVNSNGPLNNKINENRSANNPEQNKPGVFGAVKNVFNKAHQSDRPRTTHVLGANLGLKDALSKALKEGEIKEVVPGIAPKSPIEEAKIAPAPISLSALRPTPAPSLAGNDRAANSDAMNKLKSFITEKVEEPVIQKTEIPKVAEIPKIVEQPKAPEPIKIIEEVKPPVIEQKKEEVKVVEVKQEELKKVEPELRKIEPEVKIPEPEIKQEQPKKEEPVQNQSSSQVNNQKNTPPEPQIKEVPEEVLRKILEE